MTTFLPLARRGAVALAIAALSPEAASAQASSETVNIGLVGTLNPLSVLDRTTLDAFKSRPLFSATRRPPPASPQIFVPTPPAVALSQAPDLRLIGVVSGVDKAVAILRRPSGGPSLSLKVGDTVETWRVQAISPDRVILREGDREQIYRLFAVGKIGTTPSPNRLSSGAPLPTPGFP